MDPKHRPPRQLTERELSRLLAVNEPAGVAPYLIVPQQNALYARGTGALDLSQFALGFGRHLIDQIEVPDHRVYVTLDEYLPQRNREAFGLDSAHAVGFILRQYTPRELLIALAVLNRLGDKDDQAADLERTYIACLAPGPGALMRSLLSVPEPRQFLARQPILLAMKEVILNGGEPSEPPSLPLIPAAVMLAHAIATGIAGIGEGGPELWQGMPQDALMEVVCNASFNVHDDPLSRLDRMWRVWIEHGQSSANPPTRLPFDAMASEALGADMGSVVMLGFYLYYLTTTWRSSDPVLVHREIVPGTPKAALDPLLNYCAADIANLAARLHQRPGRWGFLPFEESPVLDLGEALLVLDEDYLLRRVTTGLYWPVDRNEKQLGGTKGQQAWKIAYGQATEAAVHDQIAALTPSLPLIGTISRQQSYFTDREVIAAYPAAKKGMIRKQCDAAVWTGHDVWLTFEIVTRELQVPTRQAAQLPKFRDDVARMVTEKLEQLLETSSCIVSDYGAALLGFQPPRVRVQPVLVHGGAFPVHPVTMAFVDDQLRRATGWKDARIEDPLILHIDELEVLEAVAERGEDVLALLNAWQKSNRRNGPLKNYLIATGLMQRPTRTSEGRLREILTALHDGAEDVA